MLEAKFCVLRFDLPFGYATIPSEKYSHSVNEKYFRK